MRKTVLFSILFVLAGSGLFSSCRSAQAGEDTGTIPAFTWKGANVYFLLTDRFFNGDPDNDVNFDRTRETGVLRGFEGGDIRGVVQKLEEGYFDRLGINALWLTPWFEQIHGGTDEGTGLTYAFHGYWPGDWTAIDPNFGTEADLLELVETAHAHGIRVVMDVIINHTGPVTEQDPVWPEEWVRTRPQCTYQDYRSTVTCTLVRNLPDIRTEAVQPLDLPPQLLEKWEREGRLQQELSELDAFFERTGYPRTPRYYLIKWLTDYVRKYGIDAYRLDTAKHIEEDIWGELGQEAEAAFQEWKRTHPDQVLDDNTFFMVGEVYGFGISGGREFDFGDRKVDFFDHGIQSLINFEFKESARMPYEQLFSSYSTMLSGGLQGVGVLNYLSSHDDGGPFDKERIKALEAGTKLLLSPGASQVYYGDESVRKLDIPGTRGDATLRSNMNWEELASNQERNGVTTGQVLEHYQKLGRFRRDHPAVGAGEHRMITSDPYCFSRIYTTDSGEDHIVAALDLEPGKHSLPVGGVFEDGSRLVDYYSGSRVTVKDGLAELDSEFGIVLLAEEP
jgi:alpha-amylase